MDQIDPTGVYNVYLEIAATYFTTGDAGAWNLVGERMMFERFHQKIHGQANKRDGPRTRIFRPARLLSCGDTDNIHLLDVSRGGALAHSQSPRTPGEIVWLRVGVMEISTRVVWVRGKRFGSEFLTKLTDAQLKMITVAH